MSDATRIRTAIGVLVLALTTKDAADRRGTLLSSRGYRGRDRARRSTALLHELEAGAAAIADSPRRKCPSTGSARACGRPARLQPPWSDLPVFLFTRPGADSPVLGDAVLTLGNVTLLERPLRVTDIVERGSHGGARARNGSIRSAAISTSVSAPPRRCASRISAKTSSSRRSVTSFAIRSRRCSPACICCR